ncbi:hypothetical protein CSKR_112018 [Clonorchis sinensis]|uniref:Uncharacterized protein n=1 Tax=Clonorchis sinensis TaxID=79923 RepID=A0A419PYB8_CLOSI|nr:hypothetical protein CSKR_112018 [Clonorchis sinensis]
MQSLVHSTDWYMYWVAVMSDLSATTTRPVLIGGGEISVTSRGQSREAVMYGRPGSIAAHVQPCTLTDDFLPHRPLSSSSLPATHRKTSGRVRVYGELSGRFRTQSCVHQKYPLSSFLYNFVIDEIMRRTLEDLQNLGVQIACDGNLVDLEHADGYVLVFEEEEKVQVFLDELT